MTPASPNTSPPGWRAPSGGASRALCFAATVVLALAVGGPAVAQSPAGDAPLAPRGEASQEHSPLAARAVWLAAPAGDMHASARAPAGPQDPWLGQDKLLHFGASFLITLSTQYVLNSKMDLPEERAWPVAAGTSLSFGLFKELADSQRERRPHFSWRDMTANALGVAAGVAVILL